MQAGGLSLPHAILKSESKVVARCPCSEGEDVFSSLDWLSRYPQLSIRFRISKQ